MIIAQSMNIHSLYTQVHVRYSLVEEAVQVAGGEDAAMKLLNEVMGNGRPDGTTIVPHRDAVQPVNVPQQRDSGTGSGGAGSEGGYSSAFEDAPGADDGGGAAKGERAVRGGSERSEGGAAGPSSGGGQAPTLPLPPAAPAGSHRTLTFGLMAEGEGSGTVGGATLEPAATGSEAFGSGGGAATPVGGGDNVTFEGAGFRQTAKLQPQQQLASSQLQQQRAAARLAAASNPANGPFRRFVLSMELRSFQVGVIQGTPAADNAVTGVVSGPTPSECPLIPMALCACLQAGAKLPLNTAMTYVQAMLPPDLLGEGDWRLPALYA